MFDQGWVVVAGLVAPLTLLVTLWLYTLARYRRLLPEQMLSGAAAILATYFGVFLALAVDTCARRKAERDEIRTIIHAVDQEARRSLEVFALDDPRDPSLGTAQHKLFVSPVSTLPDLVHLHAFQAVAVPELLVDLAHLSTGLRAPDPIVSSLKYPENVSTIPPNKAHVVAQLNLLLKLLDAQRRVLDGALEPSQAMTLRIQARSEYSASLRN